MQTIPLHLWGREVVSEKLSAQKNDVRTGMMKNAKKRVKILKTKK